MNTFKTYYLSSAITIIVSYPTALSAQTVWTDADFTKPKGQTSLLNKNVEIHNTDTVKFEAPLNSEIAVLSLERGTSFTADNTVEITALGPNGGTLLLLSGSTGYFKDDLTSIKAPSNTSTKFDIGLKDSGTTLKVDGKTSITGGARGLYVGAGSSAFLNETEIEAEIVGISAEGGTINLDKTAITMNSQTNVSSFGLMTMSNGVMNINNDLSITTDVNSTSNWSYGIYAESGGTFNLRKTNITFTDRVNGYEVGIYNASGQVSIDGDLTIINSNPAKSSHYAIYAANNGQVTSSNSVANIAGNLYAANNSLIDLTMSSGSNWEGKSTIASNGNIFIDMTQTDWNMLGNSTLTQLTANNSNIFFSEPNANFITLTTDELAGTNNHFYMNTDLGSINATTDSNNENIGVAGVNGDLLVISNTNTATHNKITINNRGSSITSGNEVLQIVSTPVNQTGDFSLSSAVEVGGYQYDLRQSVDSANNPNGWELYGTGLVSSTAKAAVNSYFNVSYLLTYVDNQTLLQRMGELRQTDSGKIGNFWIRNYAGKLNSFGGQKLDGFDMSYSGTQLGIDKQLDITSGELYLGLMAGYMKANPDYKAGSGTTKSFSAGAYLTYMDHSGFYFDSLLKYINTDNKFSIRDTQNNSIQGHTRSNGYAISVEVGRQFAIKNSPFYIEPQFELTYQHQEGDKTNASNGLEIKMDSYDSVLGRASGIFGYKLTPSENLHLDLYAKTGIIQEFAGDTSYRLNGSKEKYSLNGAWFDNSIGVKARINNRHNIYGELTYSTGHRFDKMQANLGYRFQF